MTLTQKILRPIINWAVERFFPRHFFYGNELGKRWGGAEGIEGVALETCAVAMACRCATLGGAKMTVQCFGVTNRGVDIGDWRVTMERIEPKGGA